MRLRRAVLAIPSKSLVSTGLLLYKNGPPLSPSNSTLTRRSTSVHSKRLTPPLLPLESTLTKKGGRYLSQAPKVCQLVNPELQRVPAPSPPTNPNTPVTLTPPLSPIPSCACTHFPSPGGVHFLRPAFPCQVSHRPPEGSTGRRTRMGQTWNKSLSPTSSPLQGAPLPDRARQSRPSRKLP